MINIISRSSAADPHHRPQCGNNIIILLARQGTLGLLDLRDGGGRAQVTISTLTERGRLKTIPVCGCDGTRNGWPRAKGTRARSSDATAMTLAARRSRTVYKPSVVRFFLPFVPKHPDQYRHRSSQSPFVNRDFVFAQYTTNKFACSS